MSTKREIAGGILLREEKNLVFILCVKQKETGKWGPPKGGKYISETFEQCAQREIMEETSIHIDIDLFSNKISIMNNNYYIVNITNFPRKFNFAKIDYKEIEDIKWIEFEEICKYETNRQLKEIYKKKNYIISIQHQTQNMVPEILLHSHCNI
jgi:8-oxo-dGTP pyrophosphatase MutT (NUDIX family)